MKRRGLFSALIETREDETSSRVNPFILVFSILLAILLLYFTLRDLDWPNFFTTLQNADYLYLPLVLLWNSAGFFVRGLRLRALLSSGNELPVSNVFFANMAGYLGNNILPARAGELIRAAYLARQNKISASYALTVGLVERLMDLIALIVLGSFALSATGIASFVSQNVLRGIAILGLIGLAGVFITPYFESFLRNMIQHLPFIKETFKLKLDQFLQQFITGLKSIHGVARISQFTGLTGLIWFMDAVGAVLLAFILKIPLKLQHAFILLFALGLSSAIPSTPGYVGVYQFAAVVALTPFGISKADALAFILMSQFLGYIVIGFWGLLSLWQFNKRQ